MNKIIQISFLWVIFTLKCYAQLNLPVEPFEQIKWKNLEAPNGMLLNMIRAC
jgi:hypothetical protein